jgi:hypothetical protein
MPNVSITRSSNKRSNPDSPDTLPATQKQNLRQIRRRNSVGDLRDLDKLLTHLLFVVFNNFFLLMDYFF